MVKLLRDISHKEIIRQVIQSFIDSFYEGNDAIRLLISNDSRTQEDLEEALDNALNRYNQWIVEKIRKEIELR